MNTESFLHSSKPWSHRNIIQSKLFKMHVNGTWDRFLVKSVRVLVLFARLSFKAIALLLKVQTQNEGISTKHLLHHTNRLLTTFYAYWKILVQSKTFLEALWLKFSCIWAKTPVFTVSNLALILRVWIACNGVSLPSPSKIAKELFESW